VVTVRPLAFVVGAAAAAAEQARRLPAQALTLPAATVRLARSELARSRARYDELATRGERLMRRSDGVDWDGLPVDLASVGAVPYDVAGADSGAGSGAARPPVPSVPAAGSAARVRVEQAAPVPGAILEHDRLPLDDFDHLTLPQLRGRIRRLDEVALAQLRDYERAHGDRLPVLTLLENRIAALDAQTRR
jgi:hypothetical protein